jgi:hypothetical protein
MAAPAKDKDTNPGTPDVEPSADVQLAEKAGITEGEVKALRDEAGLNQSAGHNMDIHAYAVSAQGKEYAEGEKDRQEAYKAEEKAAKDALDKDGLNEFEAKYMEAVDKAGKAK